MGAPTVRVGIVGAGNCASSFVQGLHYYREARDDEDIPGLMHARVGRYHVRDIQVTSAFDVSAHKVGKDLADALLAHPNNTRVFAKLPKLGVTVERGRTLDGIGRYMEHDLTESSTPEADVVATLRRTGTQVLVSYLPVGSQQATEWYALRAL